MITNALDKGNRVFSGAYIMPSGSQSFSSSKKHQNYLQLLEQMMIDEVAKRLTDLKRMKEAFELLRSYPLIGDFLAYQFVTDINYSTITNFSEMEFVTPGPGARSGIRKCFKSYGGLNEIDLIQMIAARQEQEFQVRSISFKSLWGRRLQLIDCQNLFCEVDKYARLAHPDAIGIGNRSRIKQSYHQTNERLDYWYPPNWGLNERVEESKVKTDEKY